jgi:hypothetical protein
VERGAAVELDRCPGMVGEDEDRGVERRLVAPPALPAVVAPRAALRVELVAPHDLRSDALTPRGAQHPFRAGRDLRLPVDAEQHSAVEPLHQCAPRVPERLLPALALAGAEPVERDREVVYSGARRVVHRLLQISRGCGRVCRTGETLRLGTCHRSGPARRTARAGGQRGAVYAVAAFHGAHGEPAASRKRNVHRRAEGRPGESPSAIPQRIPLR